MGNVNNKRGRDGEGGKKEKVREKKREEQGGGDEKRRKKYIQRYVEKPSGKWREKDRGRLCHETFLLAGWLALFPFAFSTNGCAK